MVNYIRSSGSNYYYFGGCFYKPGSQTTLAPTATPGIGNTSPTKGEVPKDAKVYEVGETAPEGVAVPLSVSDYATGKLRYYETKIENDVFTPSTFSCYEGDLLKIAITAVDKDADIVIPDMNMSFPLIKKGETKTLEGQMLNTGNILLLREVWRFEFNGCGYIIVVPKVKNKE